MIFLKEQLQQKDKIIDSLIKQLSLEICYNKSIQISKKKQKNPASIASTKQKQKTKPRIIVTTFKTPLFND